MTMTTNIDNDDIDVNDERAATKILSFSYCGESVFLNHHFQTKNKI